MEKNEILTSKYSSGINIIIRLDELWKDTHKYARSGQYDLWNTTLDRIWLELARDIKPESKNNKESTSNDIFNGFDCELIELGSFGDIKEGGFQQIKQSDITKRAKHYKVLMNKQLFLAKLENTLGKGTTYEDDDDDDVD